MLNKQTLRSQDYADRNTVQLFDKKFYLKIRGHILQIVIMFSVVKLN